MLVVLCIIILLISIYYFTNKKKHDFPGPPGWPIIGIALEVRNLKGLLEIETKWFAKYGKLFHMNVGYISVLLCSDYKFAEMILSSNQMIEKSIFYKQMEMIFGDGLLLSTGTKWRKRRKILTPCFHFKILEEFIKVFDKNGKILVQNLDKLSTKDSVDVCKILGLYTLDVICETAMGTSVNAQSNENNAYVNAIKEACKIAFEKTVSINNNFPFIYKFTNLYKREIKATNVIKNFTLSIIDKRKQFLQSKNQEDTDHDDIGMKKKYSLLDTLLNATIDGQALTNEEIREEVDIFMFEGHDTTSITLSCALYFISEHPEVQAKIVAELNEILSNDSDKIGQYNEMKYLEMVIKETMRLCPAVPNHSRHLDHDLIYEGKLIPKGTVLAISQYHLHRDPDVYKDPLTFNPERFSMEEQNKRNPFSFIAFSAGPRNCIGQKFAMLELKSALSHILKNFEVLPTIPKHVPQFTAMVTLISMNGICLRFKKRY